MRVVDVLIGIHAEENIFACVYPGFDKCNQVGDKLFLWVRCFDTLLLKELGLLCCDCVGSCVKLLGAHSIRR